MAKPDENNYSDLFLTNSFKYGLYKNFTRNDIYDKDTYYCKLREIKFEGNKDIYNLCKMYEQNLTQLSTIMLEEVDINERCRYLTFWIIDEIRKKLIPLGQNINKNDSIFKALYSVSSMIPTSSQILCKYIYEKDVTAQMWKKWKDLYDYIKNEDEIKGIIESKSSLCQIYPQYFAYIKKIHEDYKKECCSSKIGNCPKGINFNEWCTENNILKEFECKVTQKISEDAEEPSVTAPLPAEGVEISRSDSPNVEIASTSESRSPPDGDITSDKANNYITNSVVLSGVGASSVLFLLYKFTTLRSRINNIISLRKKNNNNFNEDTQGFPSNYPDNLHSNSRNDDFHVSYQRA